MVLARIWQAINAFRPWRYSLRTLFVLLTVAGVWLGVLKYRADMQRDVVAWLNGLQCVSAAVYDYGYDFDERRWTALGVSPYPGWLRNVVGDDFLHNIVWNWVICHNH
jgi:hypothetical protein